MKTFQLMENLKFGDKDPHAEPFHADREGRAILFTLKPGQTIREHNAPSTPVFLVILKGVGVFSGGDGVEHTCGPNTLLVFDAGENHIVRAIDELIFVGVLHGSPLAQK
ncbi:MAG: cupin domain-containing protein [Anaerolineaceae bacterium]|jgi:quercetin dioxygenase-like cupin family protein|nr:cupin domain-containing protein [Anaerolineaceae bacterium]OQY88922.1 MAG: hypothetical protein B6D38_07750 [Anaerolineae bacterium UTCFX1]